MKGSVKWFNAKRGYGFISGEDGNEYFVHYSGIQKEGFKTLKPDAPVTFDVKLAEDGKASAVDVVEG